MNNKRDKQHSKAMDNNAIEATNKHSEGNEDNKRDEKEALGYFLPIGLALGIIFG